MSRKIKDIISLAKSTLPKEQTPLEIIELGNGYLLVHTHSQAPGVSDRAQSMGAVDYYEVKHSASEHVLASLTGMAAGEEQPAVIKIGVILPDHKAPGMAKNVFEAMNKKYGNCPEDALSFLKTSWGDSEEAPSISKEDKVGSWSKVHDVLNMFGSLKKSMMVKVRGHKGWHELKDIVDSKIPTHQPGGGNHYTFIHNKTQEPVTVHQGEVEDAAHDSDLTNISYKRKFKKTVSKGSVTAQRPVPLEAVEKNIHSVLNSLKKSAAGFPGLQGAGATGVAAISKTPVSTKMIDSTLLAKDAESERESKLALLGSQTQIGTDGMTGKRAFLVFRGMEKDEYLSTVEPEMSVESQTQSTWTPYPDVAMKFSPSGFLVGAWVSEENIILQATPPGEQIDPETHQVSLFKVVVRPHTSQVLSTDQTKMIIKQMESKNQ